MCAPLEVGGCNSDKGIMHAYMYAGNSSMVLPEPNASTSHNESNEPFVCSEGFFYDQNGTGFCRPKCGEFGYKQLGIVIPERIAMCISLIASVIVFILALTYQRSTL